MNSYHDTIVAIATAPGFGGVGMVRLSGSKAYSIGLQISQAKSLAPRFATYHKFYNQHHEQVDQGIAVYFQAPHSFTGEDVVELHGHGSPVVLDCLVQACVALGARLARPGEFSERAFLHDKIDLTQAEAIADLIHASSLTAARFALRSLQGQFSQQIQQFNERLIHLRLMVEAAIDFPEEEIDFLNDGKLNALLVEILHDLTHLRTGVVQGVMLREGLTVVIAGPPNAGKSTLINYLAGRDVAIVTEIAGTTRDVMREYVTLDDLAIHLVDTAGLRESDDIIEQEGIKRAWEEVKRADCVLMVSDAAHSSSDEHYALSQAIQSVLPLQVPIIQVINKIDVCGIQPKCCESTVFVSAKAGLGINLLTEKIKQVVGFMPQEGQFIARRRHLDALDQAIDLLTAGISQLQQHRALEMLAEDVRLAHQALSEITGEFTSDDLLGRIFSSFCIGK